MRHLVLRSTEYSRTVTQVNDFIDWTSAGTNTSATLKDINLTEGLEYKVSVRATDLAGNISDILTGDGILIDMTAPQVAEIRDGTSSDLVYTGSGNTLNANWDAFIDPASGIAKYEVSVGTTAGAQDLFEWVDNGTSTSFQASDLSLSSGTQYFINVRATDIAGNVSASSSSDGIIADLNGPIPGDIRDGDSDDIDWTNNTSSLTSNWDEFSDELSGLDYYEYSVGTGGVNSSGTSLSFDDG